MVLYSIYIREMTPDGSNQLGKGRFPPCNSLAHARPPMDDRNEQQESQHGAFPEDSMGLGMINEGHRLLLLELALKLKRFIFLHLFAKSPLHPLISLKTPRYILAPVFQFLPHGTNFVFHDQLVWDRFWW